MTPEEAQAAINELFRYFGIPKQVPLLGNVWERGTDALVAAVKQYGLPAVQAAFAKAAEAAAVLAGDSSTSSNAE